MKAIMVMFDSLNRNMLPPYGGDYIKAPNFKRLAEKTVTFNNFFAGSLPCMPARREMHTGRYNFLHRSWGPIEAFDFSAPEFLRNNGVYTHIITDHQHYWEDGGEGYLTRYSSFECVRGQEGDYWIGQVDQTEEKETVRKLNIGMEPGRLKVQDQINRKHMTSEDQHPMYRVHRGGVEFIEQNKDADNWFLQIEHFDPHEPFFVPQEYKDLYDDRGYKGNEFDWPEYRTVTEDEKTIHRAKRNYAALVTMCDRYLGEILDLMDEHDLWEDTMLIVNTDHGYLLGEHQWWGKNCMPIYNEIANLPFFIWDPRFGKRGEVREALAQTIDIAPTLLDYFGMPLNNHMNGRPLNEAIDCDATVREAALFGNHGGHINVTDGRYVYMRAGEETDELYQYTLAATHLRQFFLPEELSQISLCEGFSFTKHRPVMKIKKARDLPFSHTADTSYFGHRLYDLLSDPNQKNPIENIPEERRMIELMATLMRENEAPLEQYERVGIPHNGKVSTRMLEVEKASRKTILPFIEPLYWRDNTADEYRSLLQCLPMKEGAVISRKFEAHIRSGRLTEITGAGLIDFIVEEVPEPYLEKVLYFCELSGRRA